MADAFACIMEGYLCETLGAELGPEARKVKLDQGLRRLKTTSSTMETDIKQRLHAGLLRRLQHSRAVLSSEQASLHFQACRDSRSRAVGQRLLVSSQSTKKKESLFPHAPHKPPSRLQTRCLSFFWSRHPQRVEAEEARADVCTWSSCCLSFLSSLCLALRGVLGVAPCEGGLGGCVAAAKSRCQRQA